MDRLFADIFAALQMKEHYLHRYCAHLTSELISGLDSTSDLKATYVFVAF